MYYIKKRAVEYHEIFSKKNLIIDYKLISRRKYIYINLIIIPLRNVLEYYFEGTKFTWSESEISSLILK